MMIYTNKTKIKYSKDIYDQYVINPINQHYIDKDESVSSDIIPETSTSKNDRNKSLIPKLKSNIGKTIIKTVTGEGYNKIKIDQDLLKKEYFKS